MELTTNPLSKAKAARKKQRFLSPGWFAAHREYRRLRDKAYSDVGHGVEGRLEG